MNNALGTIFEISLRCLLVLETSDTQSLTSDMIAAIDFISVYGKDFGISDENLHGDNNFKFSEFAFRSEKVTQALKTISLKGLLAVSVVDSGIAYAINDNGINYCSKLESDYAVTYRGLVKKTLKLLVQKPEREAIELINRQSVASARRSKING